MVCARDQAFTGGGVMNATKSNGHNSRKVAPAKLYKNSNKYFISNTDFLVLFFVSGHEVGGPNDLS